MGQDKDDGERVSRARTRQDDWISKEVEKGAGADVVIEDKVNDKSEAVERIGVDEEMEAALEE